MITQLLDLREYGFLLDFNNSYILGQTCDDNTSAIQLSDHVAQSIVD